MVGRSRLSGGETGLKKKEGGEEEENSKGEEREAKKGRIVWTEGNSHLKRSKREAAQKTGRAGSVHWFWSSKGERDVRGGTEESIQRRE